MADNELIQNSMGDKGDKPKLTGTVKKVFAAGVSAAFMTEESIRNYLTDLKLPKEILGLLVQGATKTKEEITSKVTNEVLGVIRKIDFVKEFSRFAEGHKFKISAEVEIIKKEKDKT